MARFLLSTMPAEGQVAAATPVVAALVARGHEVWWHTGREFGATVERAGAGFVPAGLTPGFEELFQGLEDLRGLSAMRARVERLLVGPAPGQLADYETILREFGADVLLTDMCSLGAMLAHDRGGPPWATLGTGPLALPSPDVSPLNSGSRYGPAPFGRSRNRVGRWMVEHVLLAGVTDSYNRGRDNVGLPPLADGMTVFDVLASPYLHLQAYAPASGYPRRHLPGHVHVIGPLPPQADEPSRDTRHDPPTEAARLLERLAWSREPVTRDGTAERPVAVA